jgi:hypothetical protein
LDTLWYFDPQQLLHNVSTTKITNVCYHGKADTQLLCSLKTTEQITLEYQKLFQKSFVVATSELYSFSTSLASTTSWAVITQVYNAHYVTTHYYLLQQNLQNYT